MRISGKNKWIMFMLPLKYFKRPNLERYGLVFGVVFILALFPLVYFQTIYPGSASAAWYNSSWLNRKALTIESDDVSGSSDLSNFPLMVRITDSDLASDAQADGDDILFTSADGSTKLSHEIESYDSGNGALVAWVLIPTLDYDDDMTIYMYYNNSGAANQEDVVDGVDDVFDESVYGIVQHLEETTTGATDFKDSTNNGNDSNSVTIDGTGSNTDAAGVVNGAVQLDGTDDGIDVPTDTTLLPSTDMTLQFWVSFDETPDEEGDDMYLINKRVSGGSPYQSYYVGARRSCDCFHFRWVNSSASSWQLQHDDSGVIASGTWYMVTAVIDGGTQKIYVNGTADTTTNTVSGTIRTTNADDFYIGRSFPTLNHVDGFMDEVRLLSVARSADWIATEYNNQEASSTMVTVGSEEVEIIPTPTPTPTPTPIPVPSPWLKPIHHWNFDEGADNTCASGGDACNSGQNTVELAATNAVRQQETLCRSGPGCFYFDGTGDYLSVADDASLDFGSADTFSISGWFRNTGANGSDRHLLGKATSATQTGYEIKLTSAGTLSFIIGYDGDTDTITSTNSYTDNQWHHFTATKNGTSSTNLYVDGILVGTDSSLIANGSLDNSQGFYLGGIDFGSGFSSAYTGFIDDIRIYDKVLTPTEIKSLYSGGGLVLGMSDTNSLSDGLVGYWKLDDNVSGDSQTITDHSGFGHDGITDDAGASGMNCTGTGKFNLGCDFDGSDDYVEVTDQANLRISGAASFAGWFKTSDPTATVKGLMGKGNFDFFATDSAFNIMMTEGKITATYLNINYAVESTTTYNDGQWHHFVSTVDESSQLLKLYLDGQLVGSSAISTASGVNTENLYFGANRTVSNSISPIDITMDEVRVYNRPLSDQEVAQLYSWYAPPVLWWSFDENTGSAIYDKSGNENTGTITGATFAPGKYGSAMRFSATNTDRVDRSSSLTNIPANNAAQSISYWYRVDSNPVGPDVAVNILGSGSSALQCGIRSSTIMCWKNGGTELVNATTPTANQWHHVGYTFDGTNHSLYVNGSLQETSTVAADTGTATNVEIGYNGDSTSEDWENGEIDEVKLFDYQLSPEQITRVMNAGHPLGGSPVGSQVVYYRFDEGYGSTANNAIENQSAVTGTISGATQTTGSSCKFGNCLDFDGSDDVVTVTNTSAIDFDLGLSSGFTISTWFNADSDGEGNAGEIFQKGTNTYCRTDTEGSGYVDIECNLDLATTDANINITDGATIGGWHHLAFVYDDAATAKVYIDGIFKASDTGSGDLSADSSNLLIGGSTSANFDGTIDEFKIYNGILNPSQIKVDLNAGTAVNFGTGTNEMSNVSEGLAQPLGYWKFDENSGTSTTEDSSGNNKQGTLNGTMTSTDWVPGKYGSALTFDGIDDYVTVADDAIYSGFNTLSFSGWFKADTTASSKGNNMQIFQKSHSVSPWQSFQTYVDSSTNRLAGQVYDTAGTSNLYVESATTIAADTWYHYVFIYNNGSFDLYLNGRLEDTTTGSMTGNIFDSNSTLRIGSNTGSNDFSGVIDEIKIWNVALSPAQVAYEYNRGKPMAHWRLDECSGTVINDASGNSLTGTLTIGATGTNTSAGSCSSGTGTEAWNNGTTGKLNFSIDLDGTDDYIQVSDNDKLDFGDNEDLTITGWFYRDSATTDDVIVAKRNGIAAGDTGYMVYLDDANDSLILEISDGTDEYQLESATSFTSPGWHHFAVVWDQDSAANSEIYLNGQADNATDTGTIGNVGALTNALNLRIGSESDGANYFDGQLDDIRIYRYALSPTQVKQVMQNGAITFGPSTGAP